MSEPMKKLGALWKKKSKKGTVFLSGKIEGVGEVVVFVNGYKKENKQPDYNVFLAKEREDRPQQQQEEQRQEDFF